jgi:hypothetical protein
MSVVVIIHINQVHARTFAVNSLSPISIGSAHIMQATRQEGKMSAL